MSQEDSALGAVAAAAAGGRCGRLRKLVVAVVLPAARAVLTPPLAERLLHVAVQEAVEYGHENTLMGQERS